MTTNDQKDTLDVIFKRVHGLLAAAKGQDE
jgi:hypothetical protein